MSDIVKTIEEGGIVHKDKYYLARFGFTENRDKVVYKIGIRIEEDDKEIGSMKDFVQIDKELLKEYKLPVYNIGEPGPDECTFRVDCGRCYAIKGSILKSLHYEVFELIERGFIDTDKKYDSCDLYDRVLIELSIGDLCVRGKCLEEYFV